jgi:UDP-N-acetylglucosamine acyltransferase
MNIHPTAVISPEATLADGVEIGPYSVIGPDVHIGKNTRIASHVVIERHVDIGENNRISQFASIGGDPQDLKYQGEITRVIIGNNNIIREYATINRATVEDIGTTIVGDNNMIMTYCHVAHNCKLASNIVMSNAVNLAGHIHVDDYAIIGGMTGVHQFTRIGAHCIIGGASAVNKDIPPYVTASGNFTKLYGLNQIGLRRRGFSEETIEALKKAYQIVFRSSLLLSVALKRIEEELPDLPEIRTFVDFIRKSERGVCR